MVIGNVLGSNMFNVFFTLGITSIIMPVPLDLALNQVVIANAGITGLLVLWVTVLRRHTIGRGLGSVLLVAYVAYMVHALLG